MSNLSILAVVLGLGVGLPHLYGVAKPGPYTATVRTFPRSTPWGVGLMLIATVWFVWNVSQESIADFAAYKNYLLLGFAAVGVGSMMFVRDFLAVRGLAVVILLLAKLMVDVARPHLSDTSWVLIIQFWAYGLVIAGMWLTISPWRMRDLIDWSTANEKRTRQTCAVCLAFGLFVAALGFVKF
jgi:hypothetical protein